MLGKPHILIYFFSSGMAKGVPHQKVSCKCFILITNKSVKKYFVCKTLSIILTEQFSFKTFIHFVLPATLYLSFAGYLLPTGST